MFTKFLVAASVAVTPAMAALSQATPDTMITCQVYATTPVPIATNPPLVLPQDVAVDGAGDIFVVDQARRDLIRIGSDENHTSNVLLTASTLEVPVGVAISPTHADLYVGDENSSTIWHLPCQTRDVNYCSQYYATPLNLTLGTAVHPLGLLVDAEDHLYIADFNGQRVWRRDVTSLEMVVVLDETLLETAGFSPAYPFGPHDLAIDQQTLTLYVTDVNNDDVWSVPCQVEADSGLACSVYSQLPQRLELTGTDIAEPAGIDIDYLGTKYITGMVNGIVAEVIGSNSVDLLAESTGSILKDPVAIAMDKRASSKGLYISDDPSLSDRNDTSQGLWGLPCNIYACVPLTTALVPNVQEESCSNTQVGSTCDLTCQSGYTADVATISCTVNGWAYEGVTCVDSSAPTNPPAPPPGAVTPQATTVAPSGDAGVAVGVTLAVLVVVGVGVFLFVRYKQGKLIIKKSSDYTTTFGKPENV